MNIKDSSNSAEPSNSCEQMISENLESNPIGYNGHNEVPNNEIAILSSEEIIAKTCRERILAIIGCGPYDIDASFLEVLQSGIASPSRALSLTKEIVDNLKNQNENDPNVMFKKWETVITLKYLESTLPYILDPLFDKVPGYCSANEETYLITLPNSTLPQRDTKVFVCKSECLNNREDGFLLYHGIASEHGKKDEKKVCISLGHEDDNYSTMFTGNVKYTVFQQYPVYEYESEMQGLRIFLSDEIVRKKMFPDNVNVVPPQRRISYQFPSNCNLNSTQMAAIDKMIQMNEALPFVLKGSPGSGKTLTIVTLIEILQSCNLGPILICTPTNISANVIVERLVENRRTSNFKRIMSPRIRCDKVSKNIQSATYHFYDHRRNCNRFYVPHLMAQITKLDVVVTTIGMAPRLQEIGKRHFKYIIIDEAAQTNEVDTGIVLSYFCGMQTRIILCGDPCQLGKVCTTKCLSKFHKEISISSMERLSELEIYKRNNSLMMLLKDNYRCNIHIMNLYSITMYQSKLRAMLPKNNDSLFYSNMLNKQKVPIRFHHCNGKEETRGTMSIFNIEEAKIVCHYVIEATKEVQKCDIGVVTPYKAQVELIRDLLGSEYKDVNVNSVAAFQSSEKRIIICSFVRNDGIGFLADSRRPNTMISRAQQMLIMVGNVDNLENGSDYFKYLMRLLREENLIFKT